MYGQSSLNCLRRETAGWYLGYILSWSLGELLVTCETLHELVVMWCTCGSLGMLVKHVVNVLVTCMLGGDVVHVRVSGYVCMPLDASTGHLCAWMTCGSHVGHLIRLEDT